MGHSAKKNASSRPYDVKNNDLAGSVLLEAMQHYGDTQLVSKDAAREFLEGAGILDAKGNLAKPYR